MRRLQLALASHLESSHVGRIVYGAIIGLALVVALQAHPPGSGTVVALIVGTAVAVGLAELYSEIVGTETRTHHRIERTTLAEFADDAVAVTFGVCFPSVFFVLAALGALSTDTAFTIARWSGLGLIAFYGYAAGRLAGARPLACVVQALAVASIGGVLIAIKALIH